MRDVAKSALEEVERDHEARSGDALAALKAACRNGGQVLDLK